jgi:glucose-1-phosphate thymidylyltransferase
MRNAGVNDVAIILGSIFPEKVREYYGDGGALGMKLHYIEQGDPKGLAHAIGLAREFMGREKFVVYLGDNLLKGGIAEHIRAFDSSTYDALVLLSEVSEPQRFGVAKFDSQGRLEALIEKPREPPSRYALVGVYLFTPLIFDAISRLKPSWRGELEITDAIQSLLVAGRDVQHRFVAGWWKDTGTVQDVIESNRLILDDRMEPHLMGTVEKGATVEGRIQISEGAVVKANSVVRGPVHIGPRSVIGFGAYVGPYTSIGSDCRIENAEIENSVIFDHVEVMNVSKRITNSIIGSFSEVKGGDERPTGVRLILGEGSTVKV